MKKLAIFALILLGASVSAQAGDDGELYAGAAGFGDHCRGTGDGAGIGNYRGGARAGDEIRAARGRGAADL